eukprot:11615613-Ditylum_brightwellii.AAC.1
MASTTEAETGALFINARKGEELCLALEEMGPLQLSTPVMADSSTMCGILNKTVKQKRSQAIDMQFYWVRDRNAQNHFVTYIAAQVWRILVTTTPSITLQGITNVCGSTTYIN